ncbi:hypothetical protein [Clostridium perfringens]|uniref:hypothetical protein n=1 Tax=Clostridium perfringens TaxID=1502 RepID=UPI0023F999A9|nr:hypothetical protein [Clostridium perfringens]WEV23697.1 hypothetical protein PL327_16495 [Clostridium perfringens D]
MCMNKNTRKIGEVRKKVEAIREELEKDVLFTAKTQESKERINVIITQDANDKIMDFMYDNAKVLKEQYGIQSRNKLLAAIIEFEADNIENIFEKLKRKEK